MGDSRWYLVDGRWYLVSGIAQATGDVWWGRPIIVFTVICKKIIGANRKSINPEKSRRAGPANTVARDGSEVDSE